MQSPISPTSLQRRSTHALRRTVIAGLLAALPFAGSAFAASNVVISQVYGGGGNTGAVFKNDFIEIFNRSGSPVSLNGWSVQYASATGTSFQVTTLPNVTLQPGQYYLVQEAAGTGGTTTLPSPDVIGTLALSGTAGKVVLANVATPVTSATAASVLDLVSFGTTATPFEGAGPTPAPSSTNSVIRADGGCTDTDQNSADFTSVVAAPRNAASPVRSCVAPAAAIIPNCPATLPLPPNTGGSVALSASDIDGLVNAITLNSGTLAAFSLASVTPATQVGGNATANLTVASSLAAGTYPVVINFANNQNQTASCTVSVVVQAASGITRSIPQIQGSGAVSPFVGTVQTTEGVVTHKVSNGFYMQDPQGDGNPDTSDGIFVFLGAAPSVNLGDSVRVTGTVVEFTSGDANRPITQLSTVTGMNVQSTGNSITPTNLTLPLASATEWEKYEGMLVRFTRPLTVSQNFFLGRFGQLTVSGSRLEKPTNRFRAGSAEAIALQASNSANSLILDDNTSSQNPNPTPYIGQDNTNRAGDTVADLTGVIDFGLATSSSSGPSSYKLQPTITPVFSRSNPRLAAPEEVGGNVKVASFNVLNFFTTFTNGMTVDGQINQGCKLGSSVSKSNCRGADNLIEFERQRAKIAAAMQTIDADVFGLMEMQNNGNTAISYLVESLNALSGSNTYAFLPVPADPAATGTDAIRVAIVYKPAKLTPVGASMTDTDAINNRPPLAQTFAVNNGKRFSLVVNHLKSKGSCPTDGSLDADQGDGQGCWNALRVKQANRLLTFISQVQATAGDTDVLTIGDYNANGAEDPIIALQNGGLVSEIERFVRPRGMPYSFVFDGEAGYLDHALTSASLSRNVTNVTEWHINADEPTVIDYNTEFKPQDLYTATPFRASDHDPVVIGLNLQAPAIDITAQVKTASSGLLLNRSTQLFNGSITITNNSTATLNGPFKIELGGLPAGVTLSNATGTHNGAPYLNASANSLAPGQSITVSVAFSNPSKVAISYSTKVFSGNF
jgi:uncharacterized protein